MRQPATSVPAMSDSIPDFDAKLSIADEDADEDDVDESEGRGAWSSDAHANECGNETAATVRSDGRSTTRIRASHA